MSASTRSFLKSLAVSTDVLYPSELGRGQELTDSTA